MRPLVLWLSTFKMSTRCFPFTQNALIDYCRSNVRKLPEITQQSLRQTGASGSAISLIQSCLVTRPHDRPTTAQTMVQCVSWCGFQTPGSTTSDSLALSHGSQESVNKKPSSSSTSTRSNTRDSVSEKSQRSFSNAYIVYQAENILLGTPANIPAKEKRFLIFENACGRIIHLPWDRCHK